MKPDPVALLFERVEPRMAGLYYQIHQGLRRLPRGHKERVKSAGLLRIYRAARPRSKTPWPR